MIAREQQTASLRWVQTSPHNTKPKLQQAWQITEYMDGDAVGTRTEWRDVPFAASEE